MTNEKSTPSEQMSAAEIAEQRKRIRGLGSALTFMIFGMEPAEEAHKEPEYPREMRGQRRRLHLKVIEGDRADPDRAEAERFLRLLDPEGSAFTFQCFDDLKERKDESLTRVLHGSLDQCWRRLCNLNAKGTGVYVTVNTTNLKGRTSQDVERVRCVFQEDDDGFAGEYPLAPSIVVESSPGKHHRYWLTDWPADEPGRADFASVMRRMVADYGSDQNAKDISRVLRLPGLYHRKGEPHMVRIVEAPGHRYSREQIVATFPPVEAVPRSKANGKSDDPYSTFADNLREPVSLEELAAALNAIPNNPDTSRETWMNIGLILHHETGGDEDGFFLFDQWSQLWEGYSADDTAEFWRTAKPRGEITVATLFMMADDADPKWRANFEAEQEAEKNAAKSKPSPHDIGALSIMVFNPVKYVVPEVIVEGLTLLCGRPKRGKSWLMLDVAVAVASGGETLGQKCEEGDVLYCALEDNQRRLQSRMNKLCMSRWPTRMKYYALGEMPRLTEGGLDMIRDWIKSVPHPRLVVIDTFVRVRAPRRKNQTDYEADYESGMELQKLANEHGVAIVIIHHTRKADADDAFDTVSGTLGLNGVVDSVLVLKTVGEGVVLYGQGRDLPELEKAVGFDKDLCVWSILGDARIVRQSNERQSVLAALLEADEPIGPRDIAAATGMRDGNVRFLLYKLLKEGLVSKVGYGKYRMADGRVSAAA